MREKKVMDVDMLSTMMCRVEKWMLMKHWGKQIAVAQISMERSLLKVLLASLY